MRPSPSTRALASPEGIDSCVQPACRRPARRHAPPPVGDRGLRPGGVVCQRDRGGAGPRSSGSVVRSRLAARLRPTAGIRHPPDHATPEALRNGGRVQPHRCRRQLCPRPTRGHTEEAADGADAGSADEPSSREPEVDPSSCQRAAPTRRPADAGPALPKTCSPTGPSPEATGPRRGPRPMLAPATPGSLSTAARSSSRHQEAGGPVPADADGTAGLGRCGAAR
jgi:hypothetical protein